MSVPWWPVEILDVLGSAGVFSIALYTIYLAHRWRISDIRDSFRHYVFLLAFAIGAFAIFRSFGHLVKQALLHLDMFHIWHLIAPFSGGGNTAAFVAIFAFSIYFDRLLQFKQQAEKTQAGLAVSKAREETARQGEKRLRTIFDAMEDPIYLIDENLNVTFFNRKMQDLLPELQIGDKCYRVLQGRERPCGNCHIHSVISEQKVVAREFDFEAIHRTVNLLEIPLIWIDGSNVTLNVARDITERKRLEEQLRHSQKMESIGRLAGGVAHDFNNMLTGIIGYCELALHTLPPEEPTREYFNIINDAGEKAAALTRQLLTFSRKQVLEMRTINLNHIVDNMGKMLSRMIGPKINFSVNLKSGLSSIRGDTAQLEQVIMNLIINARDAMPGGGDLTIETAEVLIDVNADTGHQELAPSGLPESGHYCLLSISDNGEGMSPEIREKIFEPFFTTREKGKGTGFGLAIVYGIVCQHDGMIFVDSDEGQGTTFRLYFPAIREGEKKTVRKARRTQVIQGDQTILVVDDESSIRRLILDTLYPLGYHLLEASSAEKALEILERKEREIHLVVTDIIMPGMSGLQLADQILEKFDQIKVIFMSGYTDEILEHEGKLNTWNFVQKPFKPLDLAHRIKGIFDGEEAK